MEDKNQIIEGLIQIVNMLVSQSEKLIKDNENLNIRLKNIEETVACLIENQKGLVATIDKNQYETKMLGETMVRSVDNVKYEIGMGLVEVPKVATIKETVDSIINNKASICRFGDGEFSIMAGASRQGFQRQDENLAKRLIEVINCKDENCLIAIADNYGTLDEYSYMSKNEIRYYMTDEVRRQHAKFLDKDRKYYNAYITTPYMLYSDRNTDNPERRFKALKKIWEDKSIIIIEGRLSRLGVGNDLFEHADSVIRILGPAEHAFDKYDELLKSAIKVGERFNKEKALFIIALGPTATVLAYDLHKEGFQALDLGHIDNDYEYYLNKASERYAITGKYVNNITEESDVQDIKDNEYESQIVDRIY